MIRLIKWGAIGCVVVVAFPFLLLIAAGALSSTGVMDTPRSTSEPEVFIPGGAIETQVLAEKAAAAERRETREAKPTDFDDGGIDDSEAEYIAWAEETARAIGREVTKISEQFGAASDDSALIRNRDWILQTSASLAMLNVTADQIRERQAPASMRSAHEVALQIADSLTIIYRETPAGLDNLDVEALGRAQTAMENVGTLGRQWAIEIGRVEAGID